MKIERTSRLAKAIEGQKSIGWMAMCQGFFHKAWAESQADYYKKLGLKTRYHNISRWKTMISTIMGDYSLDCWDRRNKSIHGENRVESRINKTVTPSTTGWNIISEKARTQWNRLQGYL